MNEMAAVGTKTIVISTLGGNIQSKSPTFTYAPHIDPIITEDYMENGIKKRRRLTHLSQDERLMRRKLKNRVAAQTARDRKKERMGQLEEEVEALMEENRKLQMENEKLRLKSKTLYDENTGLRSRLQSGGDVSDDALTGLKGVAPESAALAGPPQQDLPRLPLSLTSHLFATMYLTFSLSCLVSSSKSTSSRQKTSKVRKISTKPALKTMKRLQSRPLPWWGSHQRSWNPASN